MSTLKCKIKSQLHIDNLNYLNGKLSNFGKISSANTFSLNKDVPLAKQKLMVEKELKSINTKYSLKNESMGKAEVADDFYKIVFDAPASLVKKYENAYENKNNVVQETVLGAKDTSKYSLSEKADMLANQLGIVKTKIYQKPLEARGYFMSKLAEMNVEDSYIVIVNADNSLSLRPNNINATSRQKQVKDSLFQGYQILSSNALFSSIESNPFSSEYLLSTVNILKNMGMNDVTFELMSKENAMEYIKENNLSSNIDVYQAGALYDSVNHKIIVISNSNDINNERSDIQRYNNVALKAIHEYVHAMTVDFIRDSSNQYSQAFNNYYGKVKQQLINDDFYKLPKREQEMISYALQSPEEFIANLFDNTAFQNYLKTKKPIRPGFTFKSMWNEILNILSKLFGGKLDESMLDEAMQLSYEVINVAQNKSFTRELSNNAQYYLRMSDISYKFKVTDAIDVLGATTNLYQQMYDASIIDNNETQDQRNIFERYMEINKLFETEENNVITSLGTKEISISEEIIPAIEEKYKGREFMKIRNELISYWKTLAEKGDKVERYIINKNGVESYVLKRVTDKQQITYIKKQIRENKPVKKDDDFDKSVFGEIGSYGHSIMEEFSLFLNMHRKEGAIMGVNNGNNVTFDYSGLDLRFDNNTNQFESRKDYTARKRDELYSLMEFKSQYKVDGIRQELIDFMEKAKSEIDKNDYASTSMFDEQQLKMMLETLLGIWYEMSVTQYEINQLNNTEHTFIPLSEIKTYNEKTDTAGTKDLMVIYSDGTVGFFDYKFSFSGVHSYFTREETTDGFIENAAMDKYGEEYGDQVLYSRKPFEKTITKMVDGRPKAVDVHEYYLFDLKKWYRPYASKLKGYNEQLSDYAKDAVDIHGAKGIRQARIIPFIGKLLYEAGTTYPSVDILVNSDTNYTLKSIATSVEQTTDKLLNEFLNEMQNKLPGIANNLKNTNEGNPLDYESQRNIETAISRIKTHKDLSIMLNALLDLKENISILEQKYLNPDITDNISVDDADFNAINSYKRLINLYGELAKGLEYITRHRELINERDAEFETLKNQVNSLLTNLKVMSDTVEQISSIMTLTVFDNEKVFVDKDAYLRNTYEFRDLNFAEYQLNRFGNLRIPTMELFKKLLDKNVFTPERKAIQQEAERFEKLRVEYEKWIQKTYPSYKGTEMYSLLIRETYRANDIELESEYDPKKWDSSFFEIRKETNLDVREKMIAKFKEKIQNNAAYNKKVDWYESMMEKYEDYPTIYEKYRNALTSFEKQHGVRYISDNLTLSNKKYLEPKTEYYGEFASEKYIELQKEENKPAMKMLEYFYEMNKKIMKLSGHHAEKMYVNQIPNVLKSYVEMNEANLKANVMITAGTTLATTAMGGLNGLAAGVALGNTLSQAYNEYNSYYDNNSIEKKEGLSRYLRHLLQKTFVNDNQSNNNRGGVDMTNLLDINFDELEIPMAFVDNIDNAYKYKSKDLGISFLLMLQSAHMHNGRNSVKGISHTLVQHIENSTFMKDANKGVLNEVTSKLDEMMGIDNEKSNTNYVKLANSMLLEHIYGMSNQDVDYVIGELEGNQISAQKLLGELNNRFGILQLAGNYVSAAGGYVGARLQIRAEANKGLHFNTSQLSEVQTAIDNFDTKTILGELLFDMSQQSISDERIAKSSSIELKRKITEYAGTMPLMFMQYIAENRTTKDVVAAMMRNYGIVKYNDKIYVKPLSQLKTMFKGLSYTDNEGVSHIYNVDNFKSIYDAMEIPEDINKKKLKEQLNNDAFKLVTLKDVNGDKLDILDDNSQYEDDAHIQFRNITRFVIGTTRGYQPSEEKAMADKYILGKLLMKFRGWIPAMARERFGAEAFNTTTKQLEGGRMVLGLQTILNDNQKEGRQVLKRMKDLALEVMSFNYIEGMKTFSKEDNDKVNHYYEVWKIKNPGNYKQLLSEFLGNEDLAYQEYKNMRVQQLSALASELRIYLSMLSFVTLLAMMGFDDEEETNYFATQVYKIANRGLLETAYFMNPYEAKNLVTKAPAPMLGFVETALNFGWNTIGEGKDMTIGLVTGDGFTQKMLTSNYNVIFDNEYNIDPGFSKKNDSSPPGTYLVKFMPGLSGFLRSAGVKASEGGILTSLGLISDDDDISRKGSQ